MSFWLRRPEPCWAPWATVLVQRPPSPGDRPEVGSPVPPRATNCSPGSRCATMCRWCCRGRRRAVGERHPQLVECALYSVDMVDEAAAARRAAASRCPSGRTEQPGGALPSPKPSESWAWGRRLTRAMATLLTTRKFLFVAVKRWWPGGRTEAGHGASVVGGWRCEPVAAAPGVAEPDLSAAVPPMVGSPYCALVLDVGRGHVVSVVPF